MGAQNALPIANLAWLRVTSRHPADNLLALGRRCDARAAGVPLDKALKAIGRLG